MHQGDVHHPPHCKTVSGQVLSSVCHVTVKSCGLVRIGPLLLHKFVVRWREGRCLQGLQLAGVCTQVE